MCKEFKVSHGRLPYPLFSPRIPLPYSVPSLGLERHCALAYRSPSAPPKLFMLFLYRFDYVIAYSVSLLGTEGVLCHSSFLSPWSDE